MVIRIYKIYRVRQLITLPLRMREDVFLQTICRPHPTLLFLFHHQQRFTSTWTDITFTGSPHEASALSQERESTSTLPRLLYVCHTATDLSNRSTLRFTLVEQYELPTVFTAHSDVGRGRIKAIHMYAKPNSIDKRGKEGKGRACIIIYSVCYTKFMRGTTLQFILIFQCFAAYKSRAFLLSTF